MHERIRLPSWSRLMLTKSRLFFFLSSFCFILLHWEKVAVIFFFFVVGRHETYWRMLVDSWNLIIDPIEWNRNKTVSQVLLCRFYESFSIHFDFDYSYFAGSIGFHEKNVMDTLLIWVFIFLCVHIFSPILSMKQFEQRPRRDGKHQIDRFGLN